MCFLPKTECLVIKSFDGRLFVTIDEKVYELRELVRNEKYSKNFEKVKKIKERKKYISLMTYPWKLALFKKQMKNYEKL